MYHTFFYSYFAFCGQRKQATTKFCMFLLPELGYGP